MSFDNKVVIVTGGSAGIGAAISLYFAKEKAHVVIVGRNETKLEEVAKNCAKVGHKPLTIKADITKDERVKKIIEDTLQKYGKIDVLINNAGILGTGRKVREENLVHVYDEVMNTNLRPVVLLTNLAVPHLIKTQGNIVNISSGSGIRGSPGYSMYATSKAAINHFGTVAALELAEEGVRVNTVSPGPVETDIFIGHKYKTIDQVKAMLPLKRMIAPKEIAEVVAFIANEKRISITGSNYVIDSGSAIRE